MFGLIRGVTEDVVLVYQTGIIVMRVVTPRLNRQVGMVREKTSRDRKET